MDVVSKVKELNLPLGSYVVCGSGIFQPLGIREVDDVDMVVKEEVYKSFKHKGWVQKTLPSGREVLVNDVYEIGTNWNMGALCDYNPDPNELIEKSEVIDGVAFVPLKEVRRWKSLLAREKDLKDIELIDRYLASL